MREPPTYVRYGLVRPNLDEVSKSGPPETLVAYLRESATNEYTFCQERLVRAPRRQQQVEKLVSEICKFDDLNDPKTAETLARLERELLETALMHHMPKRRLMLQRRRPHQRLFIWRRHVFECGTARKNACIYIFISQCRLAQKVATEAWDVRRASKPMRALNIGKKRSTLRSSMGALSTAFAIILLFSANLVFKGPSPSFMEPRATLAWNSSSDLLK